jgi:hypothetical protein
MQPALMLLLRCIVHCVQQCTGCLSSKMGFIRVLFVEAGARPGKHVACAQQRCADCVCTSGFPTAVAATGWMQRTGKVLCMLLLLGPAGRYGF